MEKLITQIKKYLGTNFERNLLDAAWANYQDTKNALRLNNFAYAMRELTRHFLERLSPDEEVLNAPWFEPNDPQKPEQITRGQRILYAIQLWFSEDFADNQLHLNTKEISKELESSIKELNKYTHVNPSTFNVDFDTSENVAFEILSSTLRLFIEITNCECKIFDAVIDYIDAELVSQFYVETHNEIDMLATHHEVLGYMITNIQQVNKDDTYLYMAASGKVNVRLQYGSDGDMRRGDGYETTIILPFTSSFKANYKNQDGNIRLEDSVVTVDNDEFYH